MKNLIFVTYDGIQNSVFSGQVVQPLLKKINNNPNIKVWIVSFEKNYLSKEIIIKYIPINKNLVFIYYRRLPVLGKISLYPSIYYLKKLLKQFSSYEIISRGPLVGWVTTKAINKNCTLHILQARGLLAEEYEFTHLPQKNIFQYLWHTWRKNTLFKIEQEAYTLRQASDLDKASTDTQGERDFLIKPVSSALSDYLIQTYKVNPDQISIENDDIPESITKEQKLKWRLQVRKQLNIAANAQIFCYNGAIKSWQCPELVIEFFVLRQAQDDRVGLKSFLLILTQDKDQFENLLLNNKNIKNFLVLTVNHIEIYKYLCACDYGLIFRKSNHIVNWVSRPVKAMEYKAADLKIIHNNTVKWLTEEIEY